MGTLSLSELLTALRSAGFQRGLKRFLFALEAVSHPAIWILREEQENPLWFLVDPLLDGVDDDDHGYRLVYLAAQKDEELLAAVTEQLIDYSGADMLASAVFAIDPAVPGESARAHTEHGLRHLAAEEWHHSWPPLVIGLEGQVRARALATGAIDAEGRLAESGHRPGVEGIAKQLGLADDFERFLIRRVYGGTGHLFRHGVAQAGVERQAVLMAVGVAGWLNVIGDPEPWSWLVSRLEASRRLNEALARHAAEADAFITDLMAKSLEGKSLDELMTIEQLFREEKS